MATSHNFSAELRRPGTTRLLVAVLYALVALTVVSMFLPLLLGSVPLGVSSTIAAVSLAASAIPWMLVRFSIDRKDTAKLSELDEYEAEVLDAWRQRALTLASLCLFGGGVLAMFWDHLAVLTPEADPNLKSAYLGYLLVVSFLLVRTLPLVGFALTFNQPTEDI